MRFVVVTADAVGWDHDIDRCCWQLLGFGPLDFWKVLRMHLGWPIALADAAANYFTLAHYISGRHCRCTQMDPLHQRMLLPITSLWPITFLGGTANSLRWAYCTGGCCCQLHHFVP